MKVIDLTPEYVKTYLMCFEDWSDEMKEAGNHKYNWYEEMKDKGLGVKIALDDKGNAYGMIQYVPIEFSPATGENLYFIDCIWVHGYKEGVGNQQKKGTGIALLEAAEKDVKSRGADGIVCWGISMPFWMKASWYKKHGYSKVDKNAMAVLLWKPFTADAKKPKWISKIKEPSPNQHPGKVTVTAFYNARCNVDCITLERARRAANTFGDKVEFISINTHDKEKRLEWGATTGLYIEGKNIANGPPLSYEKIHKKIEGQVHKIS